MFIVHFHDEEDLRALRGSAVKLVGLTFQNEGMRRPPFPSLEPGVAGLHLRPDVIMAPVSPSPRTSVWRRARDFSAPAPARALFALALGACTAGTQVGEPPGQGPGGPEAPFETAAEYPVSADGTTDLFELPLGPGHGALVIRVRPGGAGPQGDPESPAGETGDPEAGTPEPGDGETGGSGAGAAGDGAGGDGTVGDGVCYQIDSVTDSDGGTWVPPAAGQIDWGPHCLSCAQRVSVGHGYGLFVFSNNGDPLPQASSVTLRVTLRDCATRLPLSDLSSAVAPASVRVESFRTPELPSPEAAGRLSLFLAFAEGTQFSSEDVEASPLLQEALAAAGTALAPAGIGLDVAGTADFDAGVERVVYSDADRGPLDELYLRADEARRAAGHGADSVLVVFAPCLVEEDVLHGVPARPDGMVPRLPGGFSTGGHADGVFLRAAGCDPGAGTDYWPGGGLLGKVMAHEIGHHLGLYHTVEASGEEDHLDDTTAANLMFPVPVAAGAAGLSPRQIRVLRSHPLVRFAR